MIKFTASNLFPAMNKTVTIRRCLSLIMHRYVHYIIILFSTAISCNKTSLSYETQRLKSEIKQNVQYGADGKQAMDIYLPEKRSKKATKVLFLIHGGSWISGDKDDFSWQIDAIKEKLKGWAIVNVNYRLAILDKNPFPTQENDVKAAATYVYERRQELELSTDWVFVGLSAGAQLAMLQGFKYNTPVKPKAVVNYFGPCDLEALYNYSQNDFIATMTYSYLLNGSPARSPKLYKESSPINFINPETPPTLTLYGSEDTAVSRTQHTMLHNKLNAAGVPNKVIEYENETHEFTQAAFIKSCEDVAAFLGEHINREI